MGLLKPEPELFTAEWVAEHRGVPESGMNCQIKVTRTTIGSGTWNPATGEIDGDTSTTIIETKARIQPLRSSVPKEVPGNDTFTQVVLISIPITPSATFKVGDILKVTEAPRNPDLLRYDFRFKELLDSGNPLERTLQCEVDLRG